MRLTNEALFPWAYQDRTEELPKFRQLARRWRPVARTTREDDFDYESFAPLNFGKMPSDLKPLPRPTWSPWLWVK